ncbi:MAG: hypothetical protein ABI203_02635, partial [Mucilaginibacter sp.]
MRLLIIIFFLPLFACAQSQDTDILGLWVKAKTEFKDGSRIVNHQYNGMDFLKYNFTADGFVNRSDDVLFNGYQIQYALKGDQLTIGGQTFTVAKFTRDTLALYQAEMGADDAQVLVNYFVRTGQKPGDKSKYNEAIKDSVYL